jgi:extradiol dioxygenase family protein
MGSDVTIQHYAFHVGDDDFDTIFARIRERALPYWADPFHRRPGEINPHDGGRRIYFEDPSGHNMEIFTKA